MDSGAFLHDAWATVVRFATMERTVAGVRAAVMVVVTVFVARFVKRWVRGLEAIRVDTDRSVVVGRLSGWTVLLLGLAAAFEELGFQLHVLLGAAGVLSVAIGFAAQTTLSNLISGFFLFGERPFHIGDTIEVDAVSGEVLGIGMLATTLRTADHRFVRIPNETLIKTRVTNATRYSVRRLELSVPLHHSASFDEVREKLLSAVKGCAFCKAEPPPQVFIGTFGETSFVATLWFWVDTKDLQSARNQVTEAAQRALANVRRSGLGT